MIVAILISCAIMGWVFVVAIREMREKHGCCSTGDFLSEWIAATIMGAIVAGILGIVLSFGFFSILAASVYLLIYYFVEKQRFEKQLEKVGPIVDRLNDFTEIYSKRAKYISYYVGENGYIVADVYCDYEKKCESGSFYAPNMQGVALQKFMYEAKQCYSNIKQIGSSIEFMIFFH